MNRQQLKQLDALFEREIQEERIKGASLLVEHKGKREFKNVYGSDREDSIYKVFSMTKPITTTAIMMLYERGLVDLFDPVSKYLEGYGHMQVATTKGLVDAKEPITLKHLLNMTSGLVYPGTESEPERIMEDLYRELHEKAVKGAGMSNLDIINALGSVPLLFHPGEAWHYGISADVIGGVVEVVTGVTYGEFLKNEIFEPLEMRDTGFYVKEEEYHRLAQMYSRIDEKGHLREADEKAYAGLNMYAPTKPPYIESAGGGLYSTLEDYSHFVQMLAAKGSFHGKRLLGRKTVEYISQSQLTDAQAKTIYFDSLEGYSYGNLMRIMTDPAKAGSNGSIGEYGWDGLPGTYFFVDPEEELMLVYMQQIEQGADQVLRRKMRQIIYAALDE
ncbi:MAG: beta-lactamase family protein [Lachnospiraceae bacterium]|nr:beta-lactamase family protein [Lachnospiraceae bacterium]